MDQAIVLIALGVMFLGGLAADHLGRMTRLPRVTVLLIFGLLVGQSGFGLLPETSIRLVRAHLGRRTDHGGVFAWR